MTSPVRQELRGLRHLLHPLAHLLSSTTTIQLVESLQCVRAPYKMRTEQPLDGNPILRCALRAGSSSLGVAEKVSSPLLGLLGFDRAHEVCCPRAHKGEQSQVSLARPGALLLKAAVQSTGVQRFVVDKPRGPRAA